VTLYVDSSALVKRYVDEPDSERASRLLATDDRLVTSRHTLVEVRRTLVRSLAGSDATAAKAAFERDLDAISIVELDRTTCELAADLAERTGARTLDALHIAAAERVGGHSLPILTFDARQAQAARSVGHPVTGA
jgi:predicted nucleic acid-binding protein